MSFDCSKDGSEPRETSVARQITGAIEEYRKLVTWDPTDLTTLNTLG